MTTTQDHTTNETEIRPFHVEVSDETLAAVLNSLGGTTPPDPPA